MSVVFALSYKPLPDVEYKGVSDVMQPANEDKDANLDFLQATKFLVKDKRICLMLIGISLFSAEEHTPNMFMVGAFQKNRRTDYLSSILVCYECIEHFCLNGSSG